MRVKERDFRHHLGAQGVHARGHHRRNAILKRKVVARELRRRPPVAQLGPPLGKVRVAERLGGGQALSRVELEHPLQQLELLGGRPGKAPRPVHRRRRPHLGGERSQGPIVEALDHDGGGLARHLHDLTHLRHVHVVRVLALPSSALLEELPRLPDATRRRSCGPVIRGGRTGRPLTGKERLPQKELRKDAPRGPDVNGSRVLGVSSVGQQQLGGAVRLGLHVRSPKVDIILVPLAEGPSGEAVVTGPVE